jgi:hypothetical protein
VTTSDMRCHLSDVPAVMPYMDGCPAKVNGRQTALERRLTPGRLAANACD